MRLLRLAPFFLGCVLWCSVSHQDLSPPTPLDFCSLLACYVLKTNHHHQNHLYWYYSHTNSPFRGIVIQWVLFTQIVQLSPLTPEHFPHLPKMWPICITLHSSWQSLILCPIFMDLSILDILWKHTKWGLLCLAVHVLLMNPQSKGIETHLCLRHPSPLSSSSHWLKKTDTSELLGDLSSHCMLISIPQE